MEFFAHFSGVAKCRLFSQANSETLRFYREGGMQAVCDRRIFICKDTTLQERKALRTISSILNAAQ